MRLRRLLLPLSSTSRFKVSLHSTGEMSNTGREQAVPPTWWTVPAASSSDIGQQSVVPMEQSSPSKKMKLTSPSTQRYNRGVRATSLSPSTSTQHQLNSRTPTNASLINQRGRASPISSDVSQRGLVKRATQTVMSRSSTRSPIRISSPLPLLSSSLSSSPSPSPSPSPPPSLTTPSSVHSPPPGNTSPSSSSFGWSTLPPKPAPVRNLGPGYEAFKKSGESIDWDWFLRNRMNEDGNDWSMIPSHVVMGGSWADVSRISQEEWDRLPGGPNAEPGVVGGVTWLLEDTAPKLEKKNETLAESTCTGKEIHSEKTDQRKLT